MSHKMNFLPQHPKIVKKIVEKSESNLRVSGNLSKGSEPDNQIVENIINKQKQQARILQEKLMDLIDKNNSIQSSLSHYNNENKKIQITNLIQKAKAEQEQIIMKINNCQKVGESTTPEEYYLWQKKKKMDEFNRKLAEIQESNRKERQDLTQICQKYKEKIYQTKQQIQSIVHEIQLQNEYRDEEPISYPQEIDPEKINLAKEEYDALVSTIGILKENNQILSSQLEDSIQSIELSLRKSFENSRSALIRELQSIRREVENSEPSSPQNNSKQIPPNQAIEDYVNKLSQIQGLLSREQAEEASKIIKPFDWSSVKWEQYLGIESEDQQINFQEKFQKMSKDHEQYQKELKVIQKQLDETLNQTVKINQQNFSVESARIKLSKMLQSLKAK